MWACCASVSSARRYALLSMRRLLSAIRKYATVACKRVEAAFQEPGFRCESQRNCHCLPEKAQSIHCVQRYVHTPNMGP